MTSRLALDSLKQSKCLDLHWRENEKEIRAAYNMKRKFDRILCREKPESSKPSVKDRRLSDSLSQNNIVDLPNSGHSSQKSTVLEFELLVNESAFEALPNLHPKVAKCNTKIFTKVSFNMNRTRG
ncbi:hypothetical protein G6F42_023066 [Rhizopus arrhizus]|nr:hypothetical protein G6F42_023066 [Rhizopus arrhizus]